MASAQGNDTTLIGKIFLAVKELNRDSDQLHGTGKIQLDLNQSIFDALVVDTKNLIPVNVHITYDGRASDLCNPSTSEI